MTLFAVIRTYGSSWQSSLRLEQQREWAAHATFMNALASDGFIVLGGPLEGTSNVLLIVRARSAEEIMNRLQDDPWTTLDLLRVSSVAPWTLRLGSLPVE